MDRHLELSTSGLVLLYNYDFDRACNTHSNDVSHKKIDAVVSKIQLFETKSVYWAFIEGALKRCKIGKYALI